MEKPTLIVISGPAGAGKTTVAHELARLIGCPAICRDELKEGMVHATPEYGPEMNDPLNQQTLTVFFDLLELMLRGGVSVVAETAYQDRLWRPGLERLDGLAKLRIVHCAVDPDVGITRRQRRIADNGVRRAHADVESLADLDAARRSYTEFDRVSVPAPAIELDTTDGYDPPLADVVKFVNGPGEDAESEESGHAEGTPMAP